MRMEEEHQRENTYDMARPEDGEDTGHFPHRTNLVPDYLFTHRSGATCKHTTKHTGLPPWIFNTAVYTLLLLIFLAIT